ncbi:MAG: cell wall hydrolase [Bdellovibrionales bacterium]
MYKTIISIIILFSSTHAFPMAGNGRVVSTPSSQNNGRLPRTSNAAYNKLAGNLEGIRAAGHTKCDVRPTSAAQCAVCNCANEAGILNHQGKVGVTRVLLSRVKSQKYPNSMCGVVWQPSQFSWTIGVLNPRRRAQYITHRTVTEPTLSACLASTAEAANIEMLQNPNELFALNYFNPRLVRPRWANNCRRVARDGGHDFYDDCLSRSPDYPQPLTESAIAYAT